MNELYEIVNRLQGHGVGVVIEVIEAVKDGEVWALQVHFDYRNAEAVNAGNK